MQTSLNPSIWTSIRGLSVNPPFVAGIYRTGVGFRNAALALQGESRSIQQPRLAQRAWFVIWAAFRNSRAFALYARITDECKPSPSLRNLNRLHTMQPAACVNVSTQ